MVTRKEFIRKSLALAVDAATSMAEKTGGVPDVLRGTYLYPPGATTDFHERCTSCGDCAVVCPENAISLRPHKLSDKDLPMILPAQKACAMCEDLPCLSACGDGALAAPSGREFPAIGLAVIDERYCLAYNGSTCMTCYDACPLKRTALKFRMNRPVVDPGACTGCGVCENVCPAAPAGNSGIVVNPV